MNNIPFLGMSWKIINVVLIYLAASGYCQISTKCRGLGINCKENVNRCPANQECVSEHLCIASRINLQELIDQSKKNKTLVSCNNGETCCDISNIVYEEHCPTGQKCTSQSLCTSERIGLPDLIKARKFNNTVIAENPNSCPNSEVCCDISNISNIDLEEYCPAGQKCTSKSVCTSVRIGLPDLIKARKFNNTITVTEKPNSCPNDEICCDISNIDIEDCPTGQKCTSKSVCTSQRFGVIDLIKARKFNNTITVTEKPNSCPSDEICCDIDVDTLPLKCGFRNINGIGSESKQNTADAEFGEFPWTLVVLKKDIFGNKKSSIYLASGSLIHPSVALTSAHSVHGKTANQLQIRAGDWNLNTTNEGYPHEEFDVESIVVHDQFNIANLRNDVALLFLQGAIDKKSHINMICLPPQGYVFDDARCFASGWGKDKMEEGGKYQVEMKKVELAIVPNDVCQTQMRQTRLGTRYRLHDSFVCAGGEGVDLCIGSGGSPLVCPIEGSNGNYYQAGISSWGIGCGSIGVPGVYGNVSHFREWIDQNMISKGFTTESYTY